MKAADVPQNIIERYVEAMDEQDWDEFVSLHCADEHESLQAFFSNSINRTNYVGVQNVESASLTEIVEVRLEDVEDMLYKEYDDKEVKVYVFGVDYEVHEDNKYYSNGINYNFITLKKEEGVWKVSEMLAISEPQRLIEDGYKFTSHYAMTIDVIEARRNGRFINYKGEEFESWSESSNESSRAVINQWTVPTDNTPLRLKTSSGTIETIGFHNYCLGVVAGEVEYECLDGEVRKAQSIATKTYTWHFLIIPKGPVEGYDLNYEQQSYKPERISRNPQITVDYNSVREIWMESYSGAIFEASYGTGPYGQHSIDPQGRFYQMGAKWLYDNNIATTYRALLKHYYDYTEASNGGPVRFFDSMKNEL